jgi:antitoxin Phd
MITVTSDELQGRVEQLLNAAQGEPISITRDGRPVAFLVSPGDMDEILEARRRRRDAVEAFRAWAVKADLERKAAANDLTDEDVVRMVHELR